MAFVDTDGAQILLHTSYGEKEAAKLVPGVAWRSREKHWSLPLSWGSLVALRGVFRDALTPSEALSTWSWEYYNNRVVPALALRDVVTSNAVLPVPDPRLRSFQVTGVAFANAANDILLADEMGTGKTVQVLAAVRQSMRLPMLVIAPNSVKRQWADEAGIWFPEAKPYVVTGSATQRRKIIEEAQNDPHAIVIVNFEAMRLLSRLAPFGSIKLSRCGECDPKHGDYDLTPSRCDVHPKPFNSFGFRAVVIDEGHTIKDPKSKQTRAVWAVCHGSTVEQRIATTGTPIEKNPADLWTIMHAIAPYDYPSGRSKFVERYCLSTWNAYGGIDTVGVNPERRDEFFKILDPHFRRMLKARVMPELPPKIRIKRYVNMTPAQSKAYKEFERTLSARNEDGELMVAKGIMASQTRLMQFAASSVGVRKPDPTDITSWEYFLREPSPKLDEFMSVVDELGGDQFVVAAEHLQLITLAAARLDKAKIRYGLITGEVSEYDRHRALQMLRAKQIRTLLFTISAGGTGLDMSCVDTIINLQRPWSMIKNKQTEDRVHRFGSIAHKAVRIIDIITRDTVEESQVERLIEKLDRLDEITRDKATLAANNIDIADLEREEQAILSSDLYRSVVG